LQYFSPDSHIAILVDRCASNRGYASRRNRAGFCARVFENFTNPAQVRQVSSVNTFSDAVEIHWNN
jgi:hypothetical protein